MVWPFWTQFSIQLNWVRDLTDSHVLLWGKGGGLFPLQGLTLCLWVKVMNQTIILAQKTFKEIRFICLKQYQIFPWMWSAWCVFNQVSENMTLNEKKPRPRSLSRIFQPLTGDMLMPSNIWVIFNRMPSIILGWTCSIFYSVMAVAGRPHFVSISSFFMQIVNSSAQFCTLDKDGVLSHHFLYTRWLMWYSHPWRHQRHLQPNRIMFSVADVSVSANLWNYISQIFQSWSK